MIGDNPDIVRRLRDVLPRGWFSDASPIANSLFTALAVAWQFCYNLVTAITALTRISTSSGFFVDAVSLDYFDGDLPRRTGESDSGFIGRIKQELFRPRGTRLALTTVLRELTGKIPRVFEPAWPIDTGAYNVGGCGYNLAGGYGSLKLPYTCFVTAFRADGQGIANIAGYATGGVVAYGAISMVDDSVRDLDIYKAVVAVLPLGSTAWLTIK